MLKQFNISDLSCCKTFKNNFEIISDLYLKEFCLAEDSVTECKALVFFVNCLRLLTSHDVK